MFKQLLFSRCPKCGQSIKLSPYAPNHELRLSYTCDCVAEGAVDAEDEQAVERGAVFDRHVVDRQIYLSNQDETPDNVGHLILLLNKELGEMSAAYIKSNPIGILRGLTNLVALAKVIAAEDPDLLPAFEALDEAEDDEVPAEEGCTCDEEHDEP